MKILITGAGGYLGSELIRQLLETEHQVVALTSDKLKIKQKHGDAVNCYSNDELFSGEVPLQDVDVVIHCAFARAHKGGAEIAKSLVYTTRLFDKVKEYRIPALINISTQEVYGKTGSKWELDIDPEPFTVYGVAKYFSELYALEIAENSSVIITSLRLAGLIGVGADTRMVSKFVDNAINHQPIKIQDGRLIFSQLDIRDAAAGIIKFLNTIPEKWEKVYNLGYLKSYTIQEIAETVKQVAEDFNYEVEIIKEPSDAVLYAELDSSRFYRDTNWKPRFDMSATVKSIFESKLKGS